MSKWEEVESQITERIKALESEKDKLIQQVNSGEQLIQRHKQEIGDARKEIQGLIAGVKLVGEQDKVDKLQKLLDNFDDIIKNTTKQTPNGSEGSDVSKELSEIKEKMTEEQRSKADKVYNDLMSSKDPDHREMARKIGSDPAEELAFLKEASASASSVRKTLFEKKTPKTETTKDYKELFKLLDKEASFVPGSGRGSSRFAGSVERGAEQQQDERRLPNGVIPRPQQKKESKD
jgi:hypothetical protein